VPEYLSPGVYIEEVNTGPRPIEGVGTAMAAFVGFAPGGRLNEPVLIANWSQYVEEFSVREEGGRRNPHLKGAYLSHAVYGYFLNKGGRCYITRIGGAAVTNGKSTSTLQLPSNSSQAIASLTLQSKGDPKGDIEVEIAPATGDEPADSTFTMRVRLGAKEEVYEHVGFGKAKGTKNVVETVNQTSELVVVVEAQNSGTLAERMPAFGTYWLKASEDAALPAVRTPGFVGDTADRTGIQGLEVAEDATMLCCRDDRALRAHG
jgi:phage tail sheath protein FI